MTSFEEAKYITEYEQAVAYLLDTPRFSSKHSLSHTEELLHRLGDPDRSLRIIHVAGTNGKGSVTAYLGSIFRAAGLRTALFTSPHLVDIRERFVCDGEMISEEEFLEVFKQVREVCDDPPTFFEYLFLMGICWFAAKQPDICVLETGLGGRLDATNSVSKKTAAVITRIGLDHMQYLGETIPEIAAEKAGIIRPGVPVFYGAEVEDASKVIENRAKEVSCEAFPQSLQGLENLRYSHKNIDFSMETRYYDTVCLSLPTPARYQAENVSLAVSCAEWVLWNEFRIERETAVRAICEGVRTCHWEARMEEILPEVFLDGGHNTDGIRAFLETVREDGCEKRALLFGVSRDKQCREMLSMLAGSGLFQKAVLVPFQSDRSLKAEELKELSEEETFPEVHIRDTVKEGYDALLSMREPGDRCYIVGSLYLAGEVKELSR